MTLGQFAVAVGAPPRWVLNALTRLGVPRRYSEPLARRLALARLLAEVVGVPLPEAFALAKRVLAEADPFGIWRLESPSGAIALTIEMPRFFTGYGARLALANTQYGEKRRGRKPSRRGSAGERARAYGVDTTLLSAQLSRTPQRRVSELNQNVEFLKNVRVDR
jgi:hypothetical protein